MASKGYMAKIGLDTSDIDKNIRSLNKELKAIDAGLKENGNSAVLAEQKLKALGEQYAAYRKKLEELQSAQQKMNNALASGIISEADYRSYEREVESVTRAIEKARAQQKALFEGSSGQDGDVDYQQLANMADAFKDIGSKANEAADVIATTFINAVKAAGIQVKDIVDQATRLYGEYQQLAGGVETLFGDDYTTVMKNADNAFKNMGISANTYMDTAMSFAASLVSSLEGDTEQAAKTVDLALQDMADNANKMGTSMGMIQNAYQGFAKQNYTMLKCLAA